MIEEVEYMMFSNRVEAGKLLAERLISFQYQDVIVYALPRGGVIPAYEIARVLHAPLDLIIPRKIGHPHHPEFAIGAVSENGDVIKSRRDLFSVNEAWLKKEIAKQRQEIERRRTLYLHGRKMISPTGKTAIIVDDGVATGLTIRVSVLYLKQFKPRQIIIAVPVISQLTAQEILREVDRLVALDIPQEKEFQGAVGAYYASFPQVTDQTVMNLLHDHDKWIKQFKIPVKVNL